VPIQPAVPPPVIDYAARHEQAHCVPVAGQVVTSPQAKEKVLLSVRGSLSLEVTFRCNAIVKTDILIVLIIAIENIDDIPDISFSDPDAKVFVTFENKEKIEIYLPSINEMCYDTMGFRHILFFIKPPVTESDDEAS
jgi:hypothetical protein